MRPSFTGLDEAEDYRAVCWPVSDDYRDDMSLILSEQLIKLGFLEYVSRNKQAGQTRLFPQLKRGAN
jgi:hypothetical protein